MAKVMDGSRLQLSGKADGQVYVRYNGGVYTRKLPKWKKESFTRGMLQNQLRFKRANEFCSIFKDSLILQIWKGVSPKMSGYALFLKTNMPAFGADGSILDAKKIQLSTGGLSFPPDLEVKRMETDTNMVEVKWSRELHVGGVNLKDELMVIFSSGEEYSEITYTGIVRSNLGGAFDLPSSPIPQAPGSLLIYLFFGSRDRRNYSISRCVEI